MALCKTVSEQLRQAIQKCGMSRYRISIETGIDQATLSRFVNKHSDLSLPNIDKVSVCIGARLVLDAKAVKRAAAKRKGK